MSLNLNRRRFVGSASAAAVVSGTLGVTASFAQESTPETEASPDVAPEEVTLPVLPPELEVETNWSVENRDLKSTRAAVGSAISTETAATLDLAWSFPLTAQAFYGAVVASPAVVGTTVYQQDTLSNVFAIDLETGDLIWERHYDEVVTAGGPNGVAVAYGIVYYVVGANGQVDAVDAATGEQVWSVNIAGPLGEALDIAPVVYDGVVYVSTIPGNASGFYQAGQRGVIHALDALTGQVLWYFDTTTDNLWGNARVNSGGGLWHPPSIDDDGTLFAGTGNAGPFPGTAEFPNATSRLGPNDYCNSLLSIDPATAGLNWYINVKPFDLFDLDNQNSPVLTDVEIGGVERKIAITTGKHGLVVAVDRTTGEELWRTPVGKHQNEDVKELPTRQEESLEVFPGSHGGVETPVAYSNGVIFLPIVNWPSYYWADGMDVQKRDFSLSRGELTAIDVSSGEILWSVELPSGAYASAVVVNDIVFTGALDGIVRGYNTTDGALVWSLELPAGLNAPFAVSGDYLLIPAGGIFIPSSERPEGPEAIAPALHAYKVEPA